MITANRIKECPPCLAPLFSELPKEIKSALMGELMSTGKILD